MTSSGTTTWNLDNSSILLEAFDRCEIRPSMLTREMISSGIRSFNLELQSWSNSAVPMLWKVELVNVPLVQGTSNYVLSSSVQAVLDAYVTTDSIDRILTSLGRTEYAEFPDKTQQGSVLSFWLDRQIIPEINFWMTPDGSEDSVNLYVMKRIEDVAISSGQTLNAPYRFLDAICARLAARLAVKYAKNQLPILQPLADMAFQEALEEDKERAMLYIGIDTSGYMP